MPSVFLAFYGHADATRYIELCDGGDPVLRKKAYLPRTVGEEINLARKAPNASSYVEIEVINNFVALKVFGNETCILQAHDSQYCLCRSTSDQHYILLLRDQDQFVSTAGRWGIVWDDDQGSISHSMHPPPLPPLVQGIDEAEITRVPSESAQSRDLASKTGQTHDYMEDVDYRNEMSNNDDSDKLAERAEPNVEQNNIESSPESQLEGALSQHGHDSEDQNAEDENGPNAAASDQETETEDEVSMDNSLQGREVDQLNTLDRKRSNVGRGEVRSSSGPRASMPPHVEAKPVSSEIPKEIEDDAGSAKKGLKRKERARNVVTSNSRESKRQKLPIEVLPERANTISEGEQDIGDTIVVAPRPESPIRAHEGYRRSAPVDDSPPKSTRPRRRPSSSQRSASTASLDAHDGDPPMVFFASSTDINRKTKTMSSFKSLGGREVARITEANILCVGAGPLKKTGSFLLAILSGCDIVTDDWIVSAHRKNRLSNVSAFLPKDREREREWKFTLKDAIARGKAGLGQLLKQKTVYLTKQLSKELGKSKFRDLANIATKLGAGAVKTSVPKRQPDGEILVLGTLGDAEGGVVRTLGENLYNKDLLPMAVLRGEVELDSDEFALQVPIKDEDDSS